MILGNYRRNKLASTISKQTLSKLKMAEDLLTFLTALSKTKAIFWTIIISFQQTHIPTGIIIWIWKTIRKNQISISAKVSLQLYRTMIKRYGEISHNTTEQLDLLLKKLWTMQLWRSTKSKKTLRDILIPWSEKFVLF